MRRGFLLVEVLLGIALLALFLSAISLTLFSGQQETIAGGDRVRALSLTEKALDATRSLRDVSFSSVSDGTHGVAIGPAKTWVFSGSSVTTSDGYRTTVTVSTLDYDWKRLVAETKWKHGFGRSGDIVLTTDMTNWRIIRVGNWSSVSVLGSYTVNNALFNDVYISGDYAFVGSETSGGGAGLYVFNISNPASPTLVTSVNVGGPVYKLAMRNSILYMVTGIANAEIKAYNVATPSAPVQVATKNLGTSGNAKALAIKGSVLYVVGNPQGQFKAINAYDISSSTSISDVLGTAVDAGTANAIALSGSSAYLADTSDTKELLVANVSSVSSPSFLGGYNLTDGSLDGLSVAVSGSSALLGREKGTTKEMILFDKHGSGIPTTPGPWYYEGSGSVVGVGLDPGACFGFLATSSGRKAFQVVGLYDHTNLPQLTSYDSASGLGRGLKYDYTTDRVYLLTNSAFLIFQAAGNIDTTPCS